MTETQWLLLALVIVAVAGVYFYIRRQASEDPWQDMEDPGENEADDFDRGVSMGGDSYIVGVRTLGESEKQATPPPKARQPAPANKDEPEDNKFGKTSPPWAAFSPKSSAPEKTGDDVGNLKPRRAPAGEEKLFIVHVASRDKKFFDGPDIHAALQEQKLKFGMHDIYHRVTEVNGVPDSVYAVANMLKPGFLDPVEQDQLSTPGLTIFLKLPGPIDGAKATREMLETAGALAERLGGEVLDDKRVLLKAQSAQFMLDEAAELDRKQRLQAQR